MKKKTNTFLSFMVGLLIFGITVGYFGIDSLHHTYQNLHPLYLIPAIIFLTLTFFINAWRLQIILKAYKHKVPFAKLLKQNLAGYAVSYVTPSARIGGEPVKAYMLSKECGVGLKTSTSAVILDKFTELLGSITIGIVGLFLIIALPNIPSLFKIILGAIVIFVVAILFLVYYFTIKGKGPFTSLFNILRFYKIKKWNKLKDIIKEIEDKMQDFFKKSNKEFFLSYFAYGIYGLLTLFEFKFIFLALGINLSVTEIIVIVIVWGIMNFVPVPAAVGFQEASQSGLSHLFTGGGGAGFAFSLIVRFGTMIFVSIGFAILSSFGGREFIQKYKSKI